MTEKPYEFQEIYREYQPRLFRYFVRLAGDNDAEDLTQETMVRISGSLDRFRAESSLSTWIYRIATNVARDRFRSAAYRGDAATVQADEEEMAALIDDDAPAARSLENVTVRKEMNT